MRVSGFAAVLAALTLAAGVALGAQTRAVPPSYVIGANDVLSMSVFGAPELADPQMQVDSDGTVRTPYGATPVKVAGLTAAQAAQAVAAELEHDQLAVNPKVELRVVQPESHPVVITGQGVKAPGTIQAIQPIRLLDALTQVGGLSDNTGAEITIVSHEPGGALHTQVITASEMLSANPAFNPWLHGGEEVHVMPGGNVYLSGAVGIPGAYALNDSDPLTVRKLMAKAHGLATAAKANQTQLIHHLGQPDQTVAIIDLPDIIAGSKPDITLAADDMVYVPTSGAKRTTLDVMSRTVSILTYAAGQLLVR